MVIYSPKLAVSNGSFISGLKQNFFLTNLFCQPASQSLSRLDSQAIEGKFNSTSTVYLFVSLFITF